MARREFRDGVTDMLERLSKTLAPMRRDENDRAGESREPRVREFRRPAQDGIERVHDWIAGDDDTFFLDAFAAKIRRRPFGGGEVKIGERAREAAIHFLGKRAELVVGAKTGFNMADRNAMLVADPGGREGGRCVSLHQQPVRANAIENGSQLLEDARGHAER